MPTTEQLQHAREKALESPDIGKRGKGKKTILRQEAKEIFVQKILAKWEKLVDRQVELAMKDRRALEFLINHLLGRPKEKSEPEIRPMTLTEVLLSERLNQPPDTEIDD